MHLSVTVNARFEYIWGSHYRLKLGAGAHLQQEDADGAEACSDSLGTCAHRLGPGLNVGVGHAGQLAHSTARRACGHHKIKACKALMSIPLFLTKLIQECQD